MNLSNKFEKECLQPNTIKTKNFLKKKVINVCTHDFFLK